MTVHEIVPQAAPIALPTVSVIVPAYNEAAIIGANLATLHEYMHGLDAGFDWEILVVDDGSTDGTAGLVDDFADSHDRVRILHHHTNFHIGQVLRFAFANTRAQYLVVLDADLSYAPDHIERLLDTIIDTRARIVIASPYHEDGRTTAVPPVRRQLSKYANKFLALSAKGDLSTLTGMVRAYDGKFIRSLNLKAMDTEINTEIIYKAQLLRARIVEIPAHLDWTNQRALGGRRRSSIRVRRSTLASMFGAFLFRPFMFFILPGLVLLAMALWMVLWICIRTAQNFADLSGNVDERFSTALAQTYNTYPYQFIVGGVALLVAIQLITLGISSLQQKRYFEELFHLGSSILRRVDDASDAAR